MSSRAGSSLFDELNWGLITLMLVLLSIGLIMLTSASISMADNSTGRPFYYLIQQLVAVVAGLFVALLILSTPTEYWERLGPLLLLIAGVLLLMVLVPGVGREVNGARRWIGVSGMNLQVSEPARLMLLMYLAGYAVRHRDALQTGWLEVAKPMAIVAVLCSLLLAEPDFGASVVMLAIALSVLFVALCVIVGVLLAVLAVTSEYRFARLTGFTNPWADPFGSGFQLTQSLIAIGSGEWFGVGLGNSVQKLFYLPEAHTDFVFAVFAEEFGLLGIVVLLSLFAALIWRAIGIANNASAKDRHYQAYLAFGIAVWLGAQVFINLGVNMGVLPTKGLTLPLVSYGRSSLIVTLAALALLLRIDMENRRGAKRGKARRSRRA
jgi:cell division protein FtsW